MPYRERSRCPFLQIVRSEIVMCRAAGAKAPVLRTSLLVALLAVWHGAPPPALAQVAMPDASAIAGTPLPAPELPDATVTVRVMRERMGNNIAGQPVTLKV